jgi:hypothetical protein
MDMEAKARELLERRDEAEEDSPEWWQRESDYLGHLIEWAAELDLRGLELWWGNGHYRDGVITKMVPDKENIVLLIVDNDDEGHAVWDALVAGWFQLPGEPDGVDVEEAVIRALASRERVAA